MILFVIVIAVISAAMWTGNSMMSAMPVASSAVTDVDTLSLSPATSSPSPTPAAPPAPQTKAAAEMAKQFAAVPSKGSVQVLNGCGAEGAAKRVADFLRSKGFDVKDIGNASSLKHQSTMVISRSADMSLANGIEKLLKTGKVVLIRNGDSMYDVTVVAGPDFEERIK
jgi:hypothetical protein